MVSRSQLSAALDKCLESQNVGVRAGDLAMSLISLCVWSNGASEVRASSLVDLLTAPVVTYRQAQHRTHSMARAISVAFARAGPFPWSDTLATSESLQFKALLSAECPLPFSSHEAFVIVRLLSRGGPSDSTRKGATSSFSGHSDASAADFRSNFSKICGGDVLQAPLV